MNSTIIPRIVTEPTSSYVISYNHIVDTRAVVSEEKNLTNQQVMRELSKYLVDATAYLKKKRQAIER